MDLLMLLFSGAVAGTLAGLLGIGGGQLGVCTAGRHARSQVT
jgi:uncharacterized membrane protein YfcA